MKVFSDTRMSVLTGGHYLLPTYNVADALMCGTFCVWYCIQILHLVPLVDMWSRPSKSFVPPEELQEMEIVYTPEGQYVMTRGEETLHRHGIAQQPATRRDSSTGGASEFHSHATHDDNAEELMVELHMAKFLGVVLLFVFMPWAFLWWLTMRAVDPKYAALYQCSFYSFLGILGEGPFVEQTGTMGYYIFYILV